MMVRKIRVMLMFIVVLMLCLPLATNAEVDLSGMSYDDLVALQEKINLALWQCDEWQEVTVPEGIYEIGKDIPAGHWTITSAISDGYAGLIWCEELDSYQATYSDGSVIDMKQVHGEELAQTNMLFQLQSIDWNMTSGTYLVIDGGSALFKPYTGGPALGFKK